MPPGYTNLFYAYSPLATTPEWNTENIDYTPLMSSSQSGQGESSKSQGEDWKKITDQSERRKIQNRNAQRKFRESLPPILLNQSKLTTKSSLTGEKGKRQKEDEARIAENQQAAGSAYAALDPADLARDANPSGLPWGSVSLEHVVEAGKAKAKQTSQQASREGSSTGSHGYGGGYQG